MFSAQVEFGKSTDTGYKDGKVIERVSNPYLQRYQVERALSSIQSSHQKAAFVMNAELGHSLQTQGRRLLPWFSKEPWGPSLYYVRTEGGGDEM